ncbi:unnamed protein product, partial [Acidithrix sp. C25]
VQMDEHLKFKESLGGYVIEGPGSNPELEDHLMSCTECQSEIGEIRSTIAIIRRSHSATPASVALIVPPRAIEERSSKVDRDLALVEISKLRRSNRNMRYGAIAASIVAVVSLSTLALRPKAPSYLATVTSSPSSMVVNLVSNNKAASPVGTIVAEPRGWGSQLVLTVDGLKAGKTYQIVVESGKVQDGAGSYMVPKAGTLHVITASSIRTPMITAIKIIANNGSTYAKSL